MALEYFLYNTLYNNTLVDRSKTSFAPLPPNTGEIYIDYLIPETQPLYLYRESGGTIIENNSINIDNYLKESTPPPTADDYVTYATISGITGSSTADNVTIIPISPFTGTTVQLLNNQYANEFTKKLNLSGGTITGSLSVNGSGSYGGSLAISGSITEGGTALLSKYLSISSFNTYSASTLTNINNRLLTTTFNIFTGTTLPANYYNKTQINTYTGTTNTRITTIENNYVSGATNLGTGTALYTTKSGKNLQFKSLSGGTNITLTSTADAITISSTASATITQYNTINGGTITTTSTTDTLMTGMQITNVVTGTYFLNFGNAVSNGTNNTSIYITIYVNGTAVPNSEMIWNRQNTSITTYHGYSGFPVVISTTSTVEIRWRVSSGTGSSINRYLTLLKVV